MTLALSMMNVALAACMVYSPVRLLAVLKVVLSRRDLEVSAWVALVMHYHCAARGAEPLDGLLLTVYVLEGGDAVLQMLNRVWGSS